jgi:hypothetical protein
VSAEMNHHAVVEDAVFPMRPLLDNGSVNSLPKQSIRKQHVKEPLEAMLHMRSVPRLYSEDEREKLTNATDRKVGYVLRKLQRGLSSIGTWCERWNMKLNKDTNQAIYFSHRLRLPETQLTFNGRNIPFVNHVKYLGVIFDKRITWRLHIEMIEAKTFRTHLLFKSEHLRANIKLALHKKLIISVMTLDPTGN